MDPFFVNIDKQVLSDLQKRLAATRWVDEFDNEKWETGTNKSYLQDLCSYWEQDFDWKDKRIFSTHSNTIRPPSIIWEFILYIKRVMGEIPFHCFCCTAILIVLSGF